MGGRGASIGSGAGGGDGGKINLLFGDGSELSERFRKGMEDKLNAEGTKLAKQVYSEFLPDLKYGGKHGESAYFNPIEGAVFNQKSVARGGALHPPFETAFHEFAHAIDFKIGDIYKYRSEELTGLKKLMKKEYKAYKTKNKFTEDSQVFKHLTEKYDLKTRGNVSDMLQAVTGVHGPLGAGHGKTYFKKKGNTEVEFFAEVFASQAANKKSYALIKKIFPNSVKEVEKVAREALKDKSKKQ